MSTAALFIIAKSETTQMSIDWWMYKQTVIHTYNGILFSLKKKGNSDRLQYGWTVKTSCWVKWAIHKKTNTIWYLLYEVPRVVKFIDTEIEWWFPGDERRGMGSCCLMGIISFCKTERVLEIGHTLWMFLTLLNCTIKKGQGTSLAGGMGSIPGWGTKIPHVAWCGQK